MIKNQLLKTLSFLLGAFSFNAIAQETPPETWQEHWFEHNQLVSRVFLDADIAVYYDNDVDRNIVWMNKFAGDVWRYTKKTYGDFGGKPHLHAIFHAYKYGGGHPSTWWDAHHDYRNVIDIGQAGDWHSQSGWNIDVISHEISHIVELGSKGVHGSPAFSLWGDSKWAEIFNYDVYINLGMTSVAQSTYNELVTKQDNFPRAGTYWFRDWFYPIYSQYGGNKVLNRYFELLAQHFPRNGNNYSRGMNWGEFVHFWSGAAGVDLKPMATNAFGWPAEWETQYAKAKTDFVFTTTPPTTATGPLTTYQHCDFGGKATTTPAGNHNLSQLQAFGFVNDDVSSLKLLPGYKVLLFKDNNFTGTQLTLTANDTCLVDNGFNDATTSLQVKTNGDVSLTGRYFLRNRNSGLYLDVANSNPNNGARLHQWTYNGSAAQQFEFSHQGEGVYILRSAVSGKAVDIDAISTANGAKVHTWDYLGSANQRFIAYKTGQYYQLVATHSSKVINIAGNSANAGAFAEQQQNENQLSSQWELIPVTTTPIGFSLLKQAESYSSMSGIALEGTTDTGGGQNVGWIEANDWMLYNGITIPASGNYTIEYRVASPNNGGRLSLDLNSGSTILGERDIPNTGSWQTWTTVSHTVYINAGTYNFRILAKTTGWNINWFRIVSQ